MIDRDTVIALADEAGLEVFAWGQEPQLEIVFTGCEGPVTDEILLLVRLVAQKAVEAEREACAAICDLQHDQARTSPGAARADACARNIRARSTGVEG